MAKDLKKEFMEVYKEDFLGIKEKLCATILNYGYENAGKNKTKSEGKNKTGINQINNKLGCNIKIKKKKTCIYFGDLKSAQRWVLLLRRHMDNGIMVGKKKDTLIKKFKYFRLNEKLYHLIWYIVEERIIYDEENHVWKENENNKFTKDQVKNGVFEWIKEYGL